MKIRLYRGARPNFTKKIAPHIFLYQGAQEDGKKIYNVSCYTGDRIIMTVGTSSFSDLDMGLAGRLSGGYRNTTIRSGSRHRLAFEKELNNHPAQVVRLE